ncbi:MAG: o-succinylbenzoate synthase [Acidobacteriota bacterium]
MRIDSIEITHVRIPLVEPFRISSGAVSEKDAIVVRVESDGLAGYGECSPMAGSFYSADTPESCWRELVELGGRLDAVDSLTSNFSKAGIETALWDLEAQRQGKPLYKLLGGTRARVESGLAVGLYDDVNNLLRAIERHLGDGYKRVKIKIEPGRDIDLVRAVRREFGDIPLFVDANGAYRIEHAPLFRELDEYGLMMFEQPFPGPMLEELAELQRQVRTPVCLDESLETEDDLRRALVLGSLRIANIKIQRVGGFGPALRMCETCRQHAIPVWVGTMPELGIGGAQGAALATLEHCTLPTDVEASLRWFSDDLIVPMLEVRDGYLQLPETPGLGYAVDREKIERYAVCSRRLPAAGANLRRTSST